MRNISTLGFKVGVVSTPSVSPFTKDTILSTPSVIQPLLVESVPTFDGDKVNFLRNDIYFLFNQSRLVSSVGIDTINAWLKSLSPSMDSLKILRSKCTDEQLLSIVKSKHIQSMSELLSWSMYLNDNYDTIISQINNNSSESVQPNTESVSETKSENNG